jgi:hypothetical protein
VLRQSCGPVRKQITKSGQVLVRTERVLGHYVFTPSGGMSGVLNLDSSDVRIYRARDTPKVVFRRHPASQYLYGSVNCHRQLSM